ncbi:MAG: iron-containing alcohol dehydrogenase [Breznakia sp.]
MFNYYQPTRLYFGENRLDEIGSVCEQYGNKVLLVTSNDDVLQNLHMRVILLLETKGMNVIHFDQVKPNPSVDIVEAGCKLIHKNPVDMVVALGGGSCMDTAKAIAFNNGVSKIDWAYIFATYCSPFEIYAPYTEKELPIITIPTTSGTGSQVTQASVLSQGDDKITFFHPLLFSKVCILDPVLTKTLPAHISAATGFDAFTHAFESYINPKASIYSKMDSIQAICLIKENLQKAIKEPENLTYRANMMLADTLAGRALANGGAAAPHPLSEIIGGILHIPHGEALAIVFASFIEVFYEQYEEAFATIASILGSKNLKKEIERFLTDINMNKKLSDYDISEDQFNKIINSPVLDFLPFGSKAQLQEIIRKSYS